MSKQPANTSNQASSGGSEDSILTPASTTSLTSQKGSLTQLKDLKKANMDEPGNQQPEAEIREHEERPAPAAGDEGVAAAVKPSPSKKKNHEGRCKKRTPKSPAKSRSLVARKLT